MCKLLQYYYTVHMYMFISCYIFGQHFEVATIRVDVSLHALHVCMCLPVHSPPPPSLQSSRGMCRNKARIVAYHLNRLLIRSKVKFGIVSVFVYILSCICIFVSLLHLCCVVLCRCRCSSPACLQKSFDKLQ